MLWEVEYTDQFEEWWLTLNGDDQENIRACVAVLQELGPALGRPLVDTLKGSRHSNMKELRATVGNIRILFAFDPRRTALLLLGGDKTNRWRLWYQRMIPIADRLYDEHLEVLQKGG